MYVIFSVLKAKNIQKEIQNLTKHTHSFLGVVLSMQRLVNYISDVMYEL